MKVLATQIPALGRYLVKRVGRKPASAKWPWITAAAAVGVASGASVALLLAPTSGKQMRQTIKDKSLAYRNRHAEDTSEQPSLQFPAPAGEPGFREAMNELHGSVQEIPSPSSMSNPSPVGAVQD